MENRKTYKVIQIQNLGFDVVCEDDICVYPKYKTKEEADNICKRFNSTYKLCDYSIKEIEDWFRNIKFKFIHDTLKEKFPNIPFKYKKPSLEISKYNNKANVNIKFEPNLCHYNDILKLIFNNAYLSTLSGNVKVKDTDGKLYLDLKMGLLCVDKDETEYEFSLYKFLYDDKDGWQLLYRWR